MFGIFNKKTSFIDIWSGTPEMHCHVLAGIDDGAKTIAQSEELLAKYKSLGCSKVIATPHTMGGIYDNTPKTISQAYESITDTKGIALTYSSEYMLDEVFADYLERKALIPLKDNYVLVEMSFFQPPENLFEQIFKIGTQGYIPVMAHPERYAYYHKRPEIFKEFKKKGCLLQLNALSLSPHYGDAVQKTAHTLLNEGLYDFIGLDTHRIDHLNKIEQMKITDKYSSQLTAVCNKTKGVFS